MNGILIINKPLGLTSHDVVEFIRRKFKIKKVGHGGTLDPQASGVLIILLGNATKLFPKIIELEKEYTGSFYLGKATDTKDASGKVILEEQDHSKIKLIDRKIVEDVFFSLIGELHQVPPMFSALHYKGKRLYELAWEGKIVERSPRIVKISALELTDFNLPLIGFRIVCSKGTYIRSLCDDIGQKINIPVCLHSLNRTRCGKFLLKNALSMDTLKNYSNLKEFVIPIPSNL